MNRRNKHEPYIPYRNFKDMLLDVRQPTPEQKTVHELVVANNATVTMVEEFQQRYEQLTIQEKERVNSRLRNVYEILGIEPGQYLEDGQDFFNVLQLLITDVKDHTVRIGRLEKLLEQIFTQFSTHPAQRDFTHDSDTTTRHDIGTTDASARRLQLSAGHATSQQKFASGIKRREVREYYVQYYGRMNQQQIADHFGISIRTLQRYLEEE
jgi:hypothetical protein